MLLEGVQRCKSHSRRVLSQEIYLRQSQREGHTCVLRYDLFAFNVPPSSHHLMLPKHFLGMDIKSQIQIIDYSLRIKVKIQVLQTLQYIFSLKVKIDNGYALLLLFPCFQLPLEYFKAQIQARNLESDQVGFQKQNLKPKYLIQVLGCFHLNQTVVLERTPQFSMSLFLLLNILQYFVQ